MYHHRLQILVDDHKEIACPLESPRKVRTVPMQVLAVGPPRSGTDSLRAALVKLGYQHVYHSYDIALNPEDDKACPLPGYTGQGGLVHLVRVSVSSRDTWWKLYHKRWRGRGAVQAPDNDNNNKQPVSSRPLLTAEDFDPVIGHCAAITDLDAAVFAHDLTNAYPDAKIVLNVRCDQDAWCRSVQATVLHLKRDWRMWIRSFFWVELFWVEENLLRRLWPAFCRGGDFEHTSRWVLEEHCSMIRGSVHEPARARPARVERRGWLGAPMPVPGQAGPG